jgi:serpin B
MSIFGLIFISALLLLAAGCNENRKTSSNHSMQSLSAEQEIIHYKNNVLDSYESDLKSYVIGNQLFAWDVYDKLRTEKENLCFSPLGLATVLEMAALGAKDSTWKQMSNVLHWPFNQQRLAASYAALNKRLSHDQLLIGNNIWIQEGSQSTPWYRQLLRFNQFGQIAYLNFKQPSARKTINEAIQQSTHHLLELSPSTTVVLTTAIDLKTNWLSPFSIAKTQLSPFYLASGEVVHTPLMQQTGNFRILYEEKYALLELPFQSEAQNDLAMWVILPNGNENLVEVEKTLRNMDISRLHSRLQLRNVNVYLPKAELFSVMNYSSILKKLGMKLPFTHHANFSGIDGTENLYLSHVIHRARMTIEENWTSLPKKSPDAELTFKADHPFLFLILNKETGAIVLLGRMMVINSIGEI